ISHDANANYFYELMQRFCLIHSGGDIPAGSISHFIRTGEHDQQWRLRIDPVYAQSDLNTIHLLAHEGVNLQQQEAVALVETLNSHFEQDGWQIEIASTHAWYLSTPDKNSITTTPLHQAMSNDMSYCLPTGDDAGYWRSALNEIQMLLHQHPVNQQRQQSGQVPVNSVWFWGQGMLPESIEQNDSTVYTNDFIAAGLAGLAGAEVGTIEDFKNVLSDLNQHTQNDILLIDNRQLMRQHGFDINHWFELLVEMEQDWFVLALNGVKAKSIKELVIQTGDGRRFIINKKRLGRWWRRDKNLSHWCGAKQ
ncbi:MAG: hypothetical protein OEY00_08595, partial [Gammaproteobacteria bacterium]|nr:hypothetical protein [Gammaproteobacteria bacterium]